MKVVKFLLLDDSGLILLGIRLNTLRFTRWCDRLKWTIFPIAVYESILSSTGICDYLQVGQILSRAPSTDTGWLLCEGIY